MKKTLKNIGLGLIVAGLLTACGGSGTQSEEVQAVNPAPLGQVCSLEQIPPTGYGIITVQVQCMEGYTINSATVTLDGVIQNVAFENGGVLYFYNVQPSTQYQAVLDVVADGEPLEPVVATVLTGDYEAPPAPQPEPEPSPEPEPTPQEICENAGNFWDGTQCHY